MCLLRLVVVATVLLSTNRYTSAKTTELSVRVGQEVILPCNSSFSENVQWTRDEESHEIAFDGNVLNGNVGRFQLLRNDLVIISATTEDSSTYRCTERNGHGEKHEVSLLVYDEEEVTIGGTAILECYPSVYNDVQWIYQTTNHNSTISSNGKIRSAYKTKCSLAKAAKGNHHLVISNSSISDSGRYLCVEDNGAGNSHVVQLVVTGHSESAITQLNIVTVRTGSTLDDHKAASIHYQYPTGEHVKILLTTSVVFLLVIVAIIATASVAFVCLYHRHHASGTSATTASKKQSNQAFSLEERCSATTQISCEVPSVVSGVTEAGTPDNNDRPTETEQPLLQLA